MDIKEFKNRFEKSQIIEKENSACLNPIVSICVTTYQHADFISDCLEGILKQKTNFDYEILLSEDDSTDGTREICSDFAKRYPEKIRLLLHHRDNNIAIGGSPTGRFPFMTNFFLARGKYIALCEGDDYWTDPYKLQKQVDLLESNPGYYACFTNATRLNTEDGATELFLRSSENRTYPIDEVINKGGGFFPTATLVFKNLINDYPNFIFKAKSGDRALSLLLADKGDFYFLNEITAVYRRHSGGIFSSIRNNKSARKNISKDNIELLREYNLYTQFQYNTIIKKAISKLTKKAFLYDRKNIQLKHSFLNKDLSWPDKFSLLIHTIKKSKEYE